MDCCFPDCEPIGCAWHNCVKNNQKVLTYCSTLRFFGHFRLVLPSLAEYFHSLFRGNDCNQASFPRKRESILENMDHKFLKWRCRRGMRELDVVLDRFLEQQYSNASPEEQSNFQRLLEIEDPELYAYMTGRAVPEDADLAALITRIVAGK